MAIEITEINPRTPSRATALPTCIGGWRELEPFGIILLTGEACAYSMRLLCDITEEGQSLLERFLGSVKLTAPDNWNSGSIGSVMLVQGMLPDLSTFALLDSGASHVVSCHHKDGYWRSSKAFRIAASGDDSDPQVRELKQLVEWTAESGGWARVYDNPGFSRNLHHMSGRAT